MSWFKWFGKPDASEPEGAAEGFPFELRVQPGAPIASEALPRVSIVILNLNGRHHLEGCFQSLAALEYPKERIELILVDNASTDGSVEEMRQKHANVRLFVNERNVGFAAGCNQGVREASNPALLVFLNNDMRVEPDWLRELVAPIVRRECSATTSKMLSWDGKLLNSAGGAMNFHGMGIQVGMDESEEARYDVPRRTLFPCGGAMAIDAKVFAECGGFDDEFFAYYEDVDMGWRLWVQGYESHYVPSSVCYHHHSSTSKRLPLEMLRLIQVRNPMLACFKNYDDENLRRLLGPLFALALRRTWMMMGIPDEQSFRIEHAEDPAPAGMKRLLGRARSSRESEVDVRRVGVADLLAVNDLLGRWEHWMQRRAQVQGRRRRSDAEIFRLFLKPHWCIEGERGYEELQRGLTGFYGLDELFGPDRLPNARK
ncbi:MAG: glycosyltransferase family 2 protein [Planctomycetes bacterium]|nr:glycosyltransferase family 2 protein [Planctomycetota bacterium]